MPRWGWPFALFTGLFTALIVGPQSSGDDWSSLWIGGILAGRGEWAEAYSIHPADFAATGSAVWERLRLEETTAGVAHPFVHNPGVAILMAAVTEVTTFTVSLYVLTFLSGACAPLMVALSYYFWADKTISLNLLVPLSLLVWATDGFRAALGLGQTSPLIFTVCFAALALARTRPIVAAGLLTAAAFVKLTPLVVIVGFLLAPSYRRAGVYAAVASISSFGLSWLTLGRAHAEWFDALGQFGSKQLVSTINSALGSLLHAPMRGKAVVAAVEPRPGYYLLVAAVIILVLGAFALTCSRVGFVPEKQLVVLSLLGPMLVANILWVHYSSALVLPLIGILVAGVAAGDRRLVVFTVVGSFVLLAPYQFRFSETYNPTTIALFVLWFATVVVVAASTALSSPAMVLAEKTTVPGLARRVTV
ncbi:glycosyltransferase family 87 protein [Corynebacterium urinipleomorphum]|uniref:glycosyltransferase family 87 protein n=1 Tax=Corynebacterium urinipleomorphum TaxID=1852380 RepID=UPI0013904E7A|nr:glycosyltransferase family 87 protein [Corynebacterium urinipleomorphum]